MVPPFQEKYWPERCWKLNSILWKGRLFLELSLFTVLAHAAQGKGALQDD